MGKEKPDEFPPEEAERRLVAALRGSRVTGHKPMTDIPKKIAAKKTKPKKKLGKRD
jgi:hypothetical protein